MSENLTVPKGSTKEQIYDIIIPQLEYLTEGESDIISNLANITAVLKEAFSFFWVGFYLVKENQLVLGPFQGSLACTRIEYGKGVCGTAWKQNRTLIVDDVEEFPGHIACSSLSRSEIVVPIRDKDRKVTGVLDIDSDRLSAFDNIDAEKLEKICRFIGSIFPR